MKRKWSWVSLLMALMVLLAACGSKGGANDGTEPTSNSGGSAGDKVSIIITNTKGEIASQWEQAAKDFMAENPNIVVETYSGAVGDTLGQLEMLTAAGKTVTLSMQEPSSVLYKYKGFGIDLSGEKWVEETDSAIKSAEGKVEGFPFAIEGFGLVYNEKVVEKAVGGDFDPYSINTIDKLKELLDKIKASGVEYPVAYQTENWSVSNHYSTQFLNQFEDPNAALKQLQEGTLKLADNAVWNGYYDVMDLLASPEYNKYGERPLGQYYDDAHLAVGKGESAILFNGNWAFDSLSAVAGDNFGFIPIPVDNNPDNPLNNKIVAGPTQILVINKEATAEQQEAAKTFLNWLVYSEKGQDFTVNKSQVVSAFRNNSNKVSNPLGVAIAEAVEQSKTLPFSTNYVIAGDWQTILSEYVQKYIAKKGTREELAAGIEDYYKNLKYE